MIQEARRRANITQAELARRLGTSQSVVARWESKNRSPSFEKTVEAVRACGFDLGVSLPRYDEQDLAQAAQNVRLTHAQRLNLLRNMTEVQRWAREVGRANGLG